MNEVEVVGNETVAELAAYIQISRSNVIRAGFTQLGLLLTVDERLDFTQIRALLASLGFRAIRRDGHSGST